MTRSAHDQTSIVKQIIDGSITIDSIGEFQSMLKIFPGNPYLHRALADLLVKRRSYAAAAEYFDRTATLFIDSGAVLQAVVAKMLQWQIVKPSFRSIKQFYHRLIENNPRATPLTMFFAGLSFREFVTLVTRLERIVLPAGKMVKKFGDAENNLYMVVSGRLLRRLYPSVHQSEDKAPLIEALEGEIFGEVYPLEKEHFSQSYTETATRVELVKITRENLIDISKHFPSVAAALGELFALHRQSEPAPYVERKAHRQNIPVRIALEVLEVDETTPLMKLNGYVRDLSISGACLILDGQPLATPAHHLIGKTVNISMSPPSEALTLNVRGCIVWSQVVAADTGDLRALGVRFNTMSPHLSGLLLVFADHFYHAH